jgi:hypothetical protein
VYGLGAVLYALLTGKPPFQGDGLLDTLAQVRDRQPEAPRVSNPRVHRDLQTVCRKCLEKEPGRRYASAEALAEDLERWLAGRSILGRAVNPAGRLQLWCRRNPLLAAAFAFLALALIALAVATLLLWDEKRQTRAALVQANQERARADGEGVRVRVLEQAALVRRHRYPADIATLAASVRAGEGGKIYLWSAGGDHSVEVKGFLDVPRRTAQDPWSEKVPSEVKRRKAGSTIPLPERYYFGKEDSYVGRLS